MKFKLNHSYTNNQIENTFHGSKYKGIRYHEKSGKAHVVLTSKISHNFYPDKISNNVLKYIGMGKKDKQKMTGSNKRLLDSVKYNYPVYFFFELNNKSKDKRYYYFAGQVKLVKTHHYYDKDNPYYYYHTHNGQRVIIFTITSINKYPNELSKLYYKLSNKQNINQVTKKLTNKSKKIQNKNKRQASKAIHSSTKQLEKHVHKNENKGPKLKNHKYQVTTSHYVRDPDVAELSRRYANYRCQLCRLNGKSGLTFIDKKTNRNYLESHHIKWLSHGGPDSIKNVIALCPTCHRMMHHAKGKVINHDVKLLKKRALKLAKQHGF